MCTTARRLTVLFRMRRLGAVALMLLTASPVAAQTALSEYEIKAAFLFHFAQYVQWPPEAVPRESRSFELCVLGTDPFGATLEETFAGKVVHGRPLAIRRIARFDADGCQILFVSSSESNRINEILRAIVGASILTVGETAGFTAAGGIINFRIQNDKLRFEINPEAAEGSGLKISSELLKLATIVHGEPAKP